jgi:hypothetical protein
MTQRGRAVLLRSCPYSTVSIHGRRLTERQFMTDRGKSNSRAQYAVAHSEQSSIGLFELLVFHCN